MAKLGLNRLMNENAPMMNDCREVALRPVSTVELYEIRIACTRMQEGRGLEAS